MLTLMPFIAQVPSSILFFDDLFFHLYPLLARVVENGYSTVVFFLFPLPRFIVPRQGLFFTFYCRWIPYKTKQRARHQGWLAG
jgi:hypothetical protein